MLPSTDLQQLLGSCPEEGQHRGVDRLHRLQRALARHLRHVAGLGGTHALKLEAGLGLKEREGVVQERQGGG